MEKLFELTFQDQTLNPQVGTYTNTTAGVGTFTLEDGEYYLTNGGAEGFYTYTPIAIQPDSGTDNKITVEFDLKVISVSALTHAILGSFDQLDINDAPTQTCWLINYNQGDIEFAHSGGSAVTLIAAADVVVDQWYHFKIECGKGASSSTFDVDIDWSTVATITSATSSYKFDIISVLGTGLHACDECGLKNIRLITDDDYFVGRTALNQALKDTKGYVDSHCMDLTSTQTAAGDKTFSGTTTTHDVIPATTDTYDIGSSTKEYNNAYIKALTINGTAAGDILTHNASEFVPRSGGAVLTGAELYKTTDGDSMTVGGGSTYAKGGSITCVGKDHILRAGAVWLKADDGTYYAQLTVNPDGTTTLNNNGTAKNIAMQEDVVPRSGGAVLDGPEYKRTVDNSILNIYGGNGYSHGAFLQLTGKDDTGAGDFNIQAHNGSTNAILNGKADGTLTWNGAPVVTSSDNRLKDEIESIPDEILDAWENLEPKQYKLKSDLENDKENAQLHYGWIAQDVESIIKGGRKTEVKSGLWLHETWEEQEEVSHEETYTEEVETKSGKKQTVTKTRKVIDRPYKAKGDSYGLRYTECLVVECKYLRRCIARLTARIEELEKGKEASK